MNCGITYRGSPRGNEVEEKHVVNDFQKIISVLAIFILIFLYVGMRNETKSEE